MPQVMLGFDAISDLVVSWALRRGESVGVKQDQGIDAGLAAAMDRLSSLVWVRLQQDSAWERPGRGQPADTPLTKHRVEYAIEAAADRDRAFWVDLQAAAGVVQRLARENPESARAAGIFVPHEPHSPAPAERDLSAVRYLALAGVAFAVLIGFVVAIRNVGGPEVNLVGGDSGQSRAAQRGEPSSSGGGDAATYRLSSSTVVPTSRKAPPGLTFVELSVEVTNASTADVPLDPVNLSVPLSLVVLGADDSCRLGQATGTVSGADCLIPMTTPTTLLPAGETRRLTYAPSAPLPADLDLSQLAAVR